MTERTAYRDEEIVHITPTVLYRASTDKLAAAVVEGPEGQGRALIVFRNQEEAEKYRAGTGNHSEAEGWRPVAVGLRELSDVLEMHGCGHVAMPEPWTGKGLVDFFAAGDFIGMLEGAED